MSFEGGVMLPSLIYLIPQSCILLYRDHSLCAVGTFFDFMQHNL